VGEREPLRRGSLAWIVVIALAWRVVYVLVWRHTKIEFGDGLYYHGQANALADGLGFIEPIKYGFLQGLHPSAAHPPLFPLVLSALTRAGRALGFGSFDTTLVHQLMSAVISSITVLVVGLVTHRSAGARAGLIAAAVAAGYAPLWVSDALVMSETLFALTIAVVLLTYYRLQRSCTSWNAAACGLAIGAAALTRAEAAMLIPILGIHLLLARSERSERSRRQRAGALGLVVVVAALVCMPWVVRNLRTFHRPVLLSGNIDSVVAGANCGSTYFGERIGAWDIMCHLRPAPQGDESDMGAVLRHRGLQYARQHERRIPLVVAARVGRTFLIFKPLADRTDSGRPAWTQWAIVLAYFPVQVLATWGVIVLRRRRVITWPIIAMALLVAVTSALTYGLSRFRVPWDVASVVAAAVGIEHLLRSRRQRSSGTLPSCRGLRRRSLEF
jgi:4-amino-4-deoxy-L-arabinose transferase-like glycosyltransferase